MSKTRNHTPTHRKTKIALSILLLSAALTACGAKGSGQPDDGPSSTASSPPATESATPSAKPSPSPSPDTIVEAFRDKALAGAPADELFAELKTALAGTEPQQADEMVRALEAYYAKDLPKTEKAFEAAEVQETLSKLGWPIDEKKIATLDNENVRKLAESAIAGGYKLETAEGYIFPVVDYGKLSSLGDKFSIAMKAYLELMAMESNAPSAKDAGLVITQDELTARLLASESYVVTFPDSPERKKAEEAYFRYLGFFFVGLNNTPVFDYETFKIAPEAQAQYEQMVSAHGGTIVGQLAKQWLDVLKETDGQVFAKGKNGEQTDIPAVKQFRDEYEKTAKSKLPATKIQ